jgi:hypothetical protein
MIELTPDCRPYADAEIVSLIVGPDATPFSIHNTVLAQSAVLAAKLDPGSMAKQHVLLPELDEATAHTLVHYMYTGKYQYLLKSAGRKTPVVSSYQAGTCVYCAAARYQLSGLIDLAKSKIMSLDKEVSISDVLAMARDYAFPLLPEDETWYPGYLESAIKSAMAKDPEPFRRPEFITQVEGSSRLLQVVWKTVINNYASAVVVTNAHDEDKFSSGKIASDYELHEDKESQRGNNDSIVELQPPASVDGSQTTAVAHDIAADPPSPETFSETLNIDDASLEDSLNLDDIEPTVETPQALDAFTDELGFEKSKMYQKMGKHETTTEPHITMDSELQRLSHKRTDSVVQAEEGTTTPTKEAEGATIIPVGEDEEADKAEVTATMVPNGLIEGASASKKSKKKGKTSTKKKSSIMF